MTSTNPPIRNGFTFAEIMFAVMILGVGFIMVAAMFPVAIRQTQTSVENLNAVAEVKRGAAIMSQLGTSLSGYTNNITTPYTNLTLTTQVAADPFASAPLYTFFTAPQPGGTIPYSYIKGDIINQLDHRFAWLPVAYQVDLRAVGNTTIPDSALVYLVAVQKRNPDQAEYTTADRDSGSTDNAPPVIPTQDGAFKPKQVYFKLVEGQDPNPYGSVYPDTIVFTDSTGHTSVDEPAADTGAYVWVADDQVTASIAATTGINGQYAYQRGAANGRYYRLGPQVTGQTGIWELDPVKDMQTILNPGPDGIYGTADDLPTILENLPPRRYDSPQPYASGNYSTILSADKPARGLLVGKGLKNPALPYTPTGPTPNLYVGTAQPILALPPIAITLKNQ